MSRSQLALRLGAFALSPLFAAPGFADVFVVAADGTGDFVDIQSAVDTALDGDTVLVLPGSYASFDVFNRSLTVTAEIATLATVTGTVRVRGLAPSKTVTLSGLAVTGNYSGPLGLGFGLRLQNNQGTFVAQDCVFQASPTLQPPTSIPSFGRPGTSIQDCASSAFVRCEINGGPSRLVYDCCDYGTQGGHGMAASGSGLLSLFECELTGFQGQTSGWGGPGGHGLLRGGGEVHVYGSTLAGGDGGFGDDFIFGPGGDGGSALVVQASATAFVRDNEYTPGAVGDSFLGSPGGQPGTAIDGAGVTNQLPGTHRRVSGQNIAWSDGDYRLDVRGEPGDAVRLAFSERVGNVFDPLVPGVWVTPLETKITPLPILTIPASGEASIQLPTWRVGQLIEGERWVLQLLIFDVNGGMSLSSPVVPARLLCDFAPDCDGNGLPDACDIAGGAALDCNSNGIPDSCDLAEGVSADCNGNGVPDVCDVGSASSLDCNADGVPDECQIDCNANGIPDDCDVALGTSADCDADLIPDECNIDCNANGVPDACDISGATSLDQNGNGVPDECQSASSVYYVDANSVPWGDGTLGLPFDNVQQALDYAIGNNEVILLDGIYTGDANRELSFGARNLRVRSQNGPTNCVFELDSLGRAFVLSGGQDSTSHIEGFTFRSGDAPDGEEGGAIALLASRATIANCVFESNQGNFHGGSIYITHPLGATGPGTIIEDCSFIGDNAFRGGSIAANHSNGLVTVRRCTFRDCTAESGAAIGLVGVTPGEMLIEEVDVRGCDSTFGSIWQRGGRLGITRSVIAENNSDFGGGIHVSNGIRFWMSHCTLALNTTDNSQGGALALLDFDDSMEVRIDNCLVFGNVSNSIGGGFVLRDADDIIVTNCSFFLNQGTRGGGVYAGGSGSQVFRNCLFWQNSATQFGDNFEVTDGTLDLDWCNLEQGQASINVAFNGTLAYGANNSTFYPGFVDPDGADDDLFAWEDNDVRLGPTSGARDAGDNASVARDLFDLDADGDTLEPVPVDLLGVARQVDSNEPDTGNGAAPIVDLGCYEDQ